MTPLEEKGGGAVCPNPSRVRFSELTPLIAWLSVSLSDPASSPM